MLNSVKAKNSPILGPFLGLFYDQPPISMPPKAFVDCNNVRIFQGRLTSFNIGWSYLNIQLNGAVTCWDIFQQSNGAQIQITGTPTDLYNYNNASPVFITPVYIVGTVAVTNGSPTVTGTGTAWNTAVVAGQRKNIRAGDFIFVGSTTQNLPGATWYKVLSVASDTSLTLTTNYGGATASGQSYTGRQTFLGDTGQHHWQWETFPGAGAPDNSDLWFAVNGADLRFKWNGSSLFGSLVTTDPFISSQIRRFKNMMCFAGLVQNGIFLPAGFANSDNGLPIALASGIAGQYTVTDGPFFANHLSPLGNTLMVYTGSIIGGEVIAATFVGSPTFWVFTEVIRGRGPIGSRLVIEFPDRHQFLTFDGEYRYNGLFVQIMNEQVWRQLSQTIDLSRMEEAYVTVNQQFDDLIWALPLTSDTNMPGITTAYVEHYLEDPKNLLFSPYTKRDFPFTFAATKSPGTTLTFNLATAAFNTYNIGWTNPLFQGSVPPTVVGDNQGKLYTLYTADTQNGVALSSFVTFPPRFVINERSRGIVKRIYPFVTFVTGNYSLNVTLQLQDAVGGPVTISDLQSMPINYSGNRFTDHFRRGRVASVRFDTAGSASGGQPWELQGYDWDVMPGGLA